jgi:hypothetical protein
MAKATFPSRRASWTFVLAFAAIVGGCFIFARSLRAGDQPEPVVDPTDAPDNAAIVDPILQFGPGQPLDFYEQFFGSR